ncbi:8664_t:CDS:2 [Entrophospora sp. SA101]|nr:8664_t:CDS:2 [Entrophospora sp. SA101]
MYSKAIKKKFKELIKEYDQAIIDLHFTKCVADEEQRYVIGRGVADNNKKINKVLEQISLMRQDLLNKLDENANAKHTEQRSNDEEGVYVPEIVDIELIDPPIECRESKPSGGKVFMKYCKLGYYVACKSDASLEGKPKGFPRNIAFLKKIGNECNYIIKFYGISTINRNKVMVMEWAKHGNLRDFYLNTEIKWAKKLEIVLDICRGITFLHSVDYLHHDIRCENILLGDRYIPKITNFKLSRKNDQVLLSVELNDLLLLNIVNWMAPEKLKNQKIPYTKQCEIFSFGMLMWELAFEKIPYEGWTIDRIKKHVTNNGREIVNFKSQKPEVKKSQDEYLRIMKEDPFCRPTFQKIVLDLNTLITIEKTKVGDSPWLRPRDASEIKLKKEFSTSNADQINPDSKSPPSSIRSPILSKKVKGKLPETKNLSKIVNIPTMLEGISKHKKGCKDEALKIFIEHVKLNNKTAKYWYGYYLLEGYAGLEKDKKKATEYFREAAEEGVPDAQLRYAHILLDDSKANGPDPNTLNQIIHYFTLAADNKNSSARYLLGSLYYYGKHGVIQDKEKGLYYIKLAAIQKHSKAVAVLKELRIDSYQ